MTSLSSEHELLLMHTRFRADVDEVLLPANQPIALTDPQQVLLVYNGQVDIFAVPFDDDGAAGVRTFLFSLLPGGAAFGVDSAENMQLIAVGSSQTKILRTTRATLDTLLATPQYQGAALALCERWVLAFTQRLAVKLPPENCIKLEQQASIVAKQTQAFNAQRSIIWVRHQQGHGHFLGNQSTPRLNGKAWWPVTRHGWIELSAPAELHTRNTKALHAQQALWSNFQAFQRTSATILAQQLAERREQQQQQFRRMLAADKATAERAFTTLTTPLNRQEQAQEASVTERLPSAIEATLVALEALGIDAQAPENWQALLNAGHFMSALATAMNVQQREVVLRPGWWTRDNGPLVIFCEQRRRSVAVLYQGRRGYLLVDRSANEQIKVTADIAATFSNFGTMFYQSLPDNALTWRDLVALAMRGQRADMVTNMIAGLAVALVGLTIPIATGILFDRIVPLGEISLLWQFGLAFFVTTLSMGAFQIVQNLTLLRMQGKINFVIEASVWQRLLALPPSFFRQFNAGDLGSRSMGISLILQTLSSSILGTLLSTVFALVTVGLLFYYDVVLALWSVGMVLCSFAALTAKTVAELRYERKVLADEGALAGRMLQLVAGISKFRAAGAEKRVFALWAESFAKVSTSQVQARQVGIRYSVFQSAYGILYLALLFALVGYGEQRFLTVGTFLAFQAALGQFMGSVLGIGRILSQVLKVVPIYERAKPILEARPEPSVSNGPMPTLTGQLELNNVTFRYENSAEPTLHNVSLHAEPGEFIAIVGPSGAGKSTLIRLLLGFEQPTSGQIYYDGHDIATLNQRALRKQMGVVLQNGRLIAGSIYENIAGPHVIDDIQIYRAARLAGFLNDIKQMPMGFHTIIGDGGSGLSGGQKQRLLLARAIINNPRILLLDESTSALDNNTQALVINNLAKQQATRIVIAHRLQTIQGADRIYVLDAGKVVGAGTFETLQETCPLFALLVERQQLSAA